MIDDGMNEPITHPLDTVIAEMEQVVGDGSQVTHYPQFKWLTAIRALRESHVGVTREDAAQAPARHHKAHAWNCCQEQHGGLTCLLYRGHQGPHWATWESIKLG